MLGSFERHGLSSREAEVEATLQMQVIFTRTFLHVIEILLI